MPATVLFVTDLAGDALENCAERGDELTLVITKMNMVLLSQLEVHQCSNDDFVSCYVLFLAYFTNLLNNRVPCSFDVPLNEWIPSCYIFPCNTNCRRKESLSISPAEFPVLAFYYLSGYYFLHLKKKDRESTVAARDASGAPAGRPVVLFHPFPICSVISWWKETPLTSILIPHWSDLNYYLAGGLRPHVAYPALTTKAFPMNLSTMLI